MAHTVYENVVMSNKLNDILTTAVDLNQYMTIDTSMTESAGMKKVINTYTSTGDVEELAMGEGNKGEITVSFVPKEYTVKTFQGKFAFYDEQEMQDPMIVDTGLTHSADIMTNKWTALAIAEFEKATLATTPTAWSFDAVVDAIAEMKLENEEGLFLLISPADKAAFRKALKDDLKYVESGHEKMAKGYIDKNRSLDNHCYIGHGFDTPWRRYFSYDEIFPLKEYIFEEHAFLGPNDANAYLTQLYGANYMTPPPMEKREQKHAAILKPIIN